MAEKCGKYGKPGDLLKIAMSDREFVRFLKVNNCRKAYISAMRDKRSFDYQLDTVNNMRYYCRFVDGRNYIRDGFACSSSNFKDINWFRMNCLWGEIKNEGKNNGHQDFI